MGEKRVRTSARDEQLGHLMPPRAGGHGHTELLREKRAHTTLLREIRTHTTSKGEKYAHTRRHRRFAANAVSGCLVVERILYGSSVALLA